MCFELTLLSDGQLVLYDNCGDKKQTKDSSTSGPGSFKCIMQSNGNLVIYGANNQPYWALVTQGHPDAHLTVQDDGKVVIYQPSLAHEYVWTEDGGTIICEVSPLLTQWDESIPLHKLTPYRVRRTFPPLLERLPLLVNVPKPCGRSPGRPKGRLSGHAPRNPAVKKTA
ncbi:MAG TPA: hypothetical protein VGL94_10705 [Ktedonobacteraceae bacterium]|jgi:hypothetical protein